MAAFLAGMLLMSSLAPAYGVFAAEDVAALPEQSQAAGGGYAVSGQIEGLGFATEVFDVDNGLPTSDANCILCASDGSIWIGGYSGIFKYEGDTFERQDATLGLTNGRVIFEDRDHRIWVGTNDNGIVMLDGEESRHITYREGLPSSSIRGFGQSADGMIWAGTTGGVVRIDESFRVHKVEDHRLDNQYIQVLSTDSEGRIYGSTWEGDAFCIENGTVSGFYNGQKLETGKITTIYADPDEDGYVYIGSESEKVYYGRFGEEISSFRKIDTAPLTNANWITSACGRIWISSNSMTGYLDETGSCQLLKDIPFNNSLEMMTADYQGNLWYTSSRQGVMKIISSHFRNLTDIAGLGREVVNSTCLRDGLLYIATDKGIQVLDQSERPVENELTEYVGQSRVRCLVRDQDNNLWVCVYSDNKGLLCYTPDGRIIPYTKTQGLVDNGTRCATVTRDGRILVGTNDGLSVISDGKVVRNFDENDGMINTVLLTVEEGDNGDIYLGTDGDGIYVLNGDIIRRIGRDDNLTSDVILRIKRDVDRGVFWIITSNSIEYMKNGIITEVDTFPYNNNFDIFFNHNEQMWILSSYGVYCVEAQDMIENRVKEYRLYNNSNGLSLAPTANSFSELDESGMLYISGRTGVSSVNIDHFSEHLSEVLLRVKSIVCNSGTIRPNEDGTYILPSDAGRIQISVSVLDYSLSNPTVHVFLEGSGDPGITVSQKNLTTLEYTGLAYGNYTLHIQIIDPASGEIYQDEAVKIVKKPKLLELLVVRILLLALLAVLVGLIVWRIMTGTVIRRQYEMIRQAKDEAERVNTAKSRFLANMSHEIRTPINTIMGMDEMILREDPEGVPKPYHMSMVNYALDIRNASESLLGLINDLLDMSKIESGKMHLVQQEYDTTDLLRSIVSMIRIRSDQKDLSFEVKIDETLPKRLYGDAGKIKQVVLNLLTNAVKYTAEGGFTLNVAVQERTEEKCSLRISVKDTGIGVKPEDMEKLFTAYERLDEEKNSGIQGTGLGLDISRRFAELMNGRLWCESIYGEGSEFILTIDQEIADSTAIGEFKEHVEESTGPYVPQFVAPDADVLVVDDNPMNLTVIKGLLKATRIFVTTAESGEECLEKLKYGSFHVVLLDHMMPDMDGLETVAKIRETWPDLPVYALTANAAAGGDEFYKSKGFDGYLSKPIDSVSLERAIMKHLPEEIMMKPEVLDYEEEPETLPEDKQWILDVEGISIEDGIKHSGGISSFLHSLEMFEDTIDANADVIENALRDEDIRLYTVKVHSLKSSARIIGAMELSGLAEKLEDAGNRQDRAFIDENTGKLLTDLRAYHEKLSRLHEDTGDDDREPVPEDELAGAYEALRELIPQMDYDSVEMVLGQLGEYRLPPEDAEKFKQLEKLLRALDWDAMEELVK